MQGDGTVRVNHLIKLVDDAVAVGWSFRVVEAGHPFQVVLGVALPDFGGDFRFDAPGIRPDPLAHGVNDGAEGQLGVGQYRQVDLVGLVQVGRVGIDMDDADAVGDWASVGAVGLPEGVADRQNHVGLAVDLQRGAGSIAAAGIDAAAQGEGVIFRENAFPHNGGGHGHGEQFRQLHYFGCGAGAHGAAAGVQDGEVGVSQQMGGALHIGIGRPGFAGRTYRSVSQNGVVCFGG